MTGLRITRITADYGDSALNPRTDYGDSALNPRRPGEKSGATADLSRCSAPALIRSGARGGNATIEKTQQLTTSNPSKSFH